MNIAFGILGNIEVDYVSNVVDIDTTSCNVSSNKYFCSAFTEFFHYTVALSLAQVTMQAFYQIATARKSDSQIVYAFFSTAEDNQFAINFSVQQTAQAFNLIFGFVVVLFNQRNGQFFFAYCYVFGSFHIFFSQAQNRARHSCREEQGLTVIRKVTHNFFHIVNKAHIQHFVSFVQYQEFNMVKFNSSAVDMVNQTTRSTNYDLYIVFQRFDLAFDRLTTVYRQCFDASSATNFADFFSNLNCKFAGRGHNQSLDVTMIGNALYQGNTKSSGFTGTGLCLSNYVMTFQNKGNCSSLNGRRFFKAHVGQGSNNFFIK